MLDWIVMPEDVDVPWDVKKLMAEVTWGKDVIKTTNNDWREAREMLLQPPQRVWRSRLEDTRRRDLVFTTACASGHLAIADWALALGAIDMNVAILRACSEGNLPTVEWILAQGISERNPIKLDHAHVIAQDRGYPDVVRAIRERPSDWLWMPTDVSFKTKQLIMQFAWGNCEWF